MTPGQARGLFVVAVLAVCLMLHPMGCSTPRGDLRDQRDEALALAERLQWDACEGDGPRLYSDAECEAMEARLIAVERGAEADWLRQRRAWHRVYTLARPYLEEIARTAAAWAWAWLESRIVVPAPASARIPAEPLSLPPLDPARRVWL